MKKLLSILILLILAMNSACAEEFSTEQLGRNQKLIMETGFKILNANNIENRMIFYFSPEKKVRVINNNLQKKITVTSGFAPFIESEEELAAVLSVRIAQMQDVQSGILRRIAIGYSPLKYEIKSYKKAVDYLANAGYNPVILIVAMDKYKTRINPMLNRSDKCMLSVYEHIYEKYPFYIEKNPYLENIYYQNFLLLSQKHRKFIRKSKEVRLKLQNENNKEPINDKK